MDIILFIQAVIMGIVEGITEFLPISSTGYLILSADIMGFWTKEKVDLFVVVVQLLCGRKSDQDGLPQRPLRLRHGQSQRPCQGAGAFRVFHDYRRGD